MSILRELKDSGDRFQKQIGKLKALLKANDIHSISDLKKAIKTNTSFKTEWDEIWKEIAQKDGGKLSLTTIGLILGSIMGGVGIAAMGGAIGLPLALVLGLGGLLGGSEFDVFRSGNRKVSIPKDLHELLHLAAKQKGETVDQYTTNLILETLRKEGLKYEC